MLTSFRKHWSTILVFRCFCVFSKFFFIRRGVFRCFFLDRLLSAKYQTFFRSQQQFCYRFWRHLTSVWRQSTRWHLGQNVSIFCSNFPMSLVSLIRLLQFCRTHVVSSWWAMQNFTHNVFLYIFPERKRLSRIFCVKTSHHLQHSSSHLIINSFFEQMNLKKSQIFSKRFLMRNWALNKKFCCAKDHERKKLHTEMSRVNAGKCRGVQKQPRLENIILSFSFSETNVFIQLPACYFDSQYQLVKTLLLHSTMKLVLILWTLQEVKTYSTLFWTRLTLPTCRWNFKFLRETTSEIFAWFKKTMAEFFFNQVMQMKNQLVVAVRNFGGDGILSHLQNTTMPQKLEEQFQFAHKRADLVDWANRKICKTLLL